MILRPYQSRTVADLFDWWTRHREPGDIPILSLPTAAGKSIIIAEIVRQMYEQWPDYHPRTVVLVPSKELAEQNADKLIKLLPPHISVGYVSASLGKKQHMADVIVATIGSIYKSAHLLGNIRTVLIDECHLVSPKGSEAGMYRKFLTELAALCEYRVAGCTATPFRGNGVWLTDGDDPLFTGIASSVTMRELLDAGYIAPLTTPQGRISTRIDASTVGIVNGDYKVGELSELVDQYLGDVASESARLAKDRKKWIAFTPSVANAETLANRLHQQGIESAVVCGETPKPDRERLINQFRAGELRCLVTVLALAVGFDVPDVDCVIWCRPTKSPVLYCQGVGRAVRIAPGKTDALVLDFTDTVERLGPVDLVKGRAKKGGGGEAPYVICDNCGARNHAAALICTECGAEIWHPEKEAPVAIASAAAVLSTQIVVQPTVWHDVSRVEYKLHRKEGKPDSMRVDYWSGLMVAGSEWICFEHQGYARQKAEQWCRKRFDNKRNLIPTTTDIALSWCMKGSGYEPIKPTRIATRKNGKFTEVIDYEFNPTDTNQASPARSIAAA